MRRQYDLANRVIADAAERGEQRCEFTPWTRYTNDIAHLLRMDGFEVSLYTNNQEWEEFEIYLLISWY